MDEQKKKLVIILGAGASAGSVVPRETSSHDWQPPITKDIFDVRFDEISDNYPFVKNFSSGLSAQLKNGSELEKYLLGKLGSRAEYEKLTPNRKAQLQQLPLYLQNLFHSISTNFKRKNLYARFVDELISHNIEVTFITLNYDLLLDFALEDSCFTKFDTPDKYLKILEDWAYFKVHGSVNWFYEVATHKQTGANLDSWKGVANEIDLYKDLKQSVQILDLDSQFKEGYFNNVPYYPALSIPNGDYQFVLPDKNFGGILASRLKSANNFLVIGFSGYAKDLLEFLKQNVGSVNSLLIVSHGGADDTYNNMVNVAPVFRRELWGKPSPAENLYNTGFAQFIRSEDFSNFLGTLN